MEALAFLFGLMALLFMAIAPVALVLAILAFTRSTRLERRVAELQASLAAARQEAAFRRSPSPPAPLPEERVEEVRPAPLPEERVEEIRPAPLPEEKVEEVRPAPLPEERVEEVRPAPRPSRPPISLETLGVWAASSLGGFALLIAGFLTLKHAIDKGWLGPEIRFAAGLGFGLLCVFAAEALWSRRYRLPAAGLGGAGLGILYGALYAGHAWYDLLGIPVTFGLMALVTAVGVVQAVRRDSQFVAVLGMLGGYLTPVVLSTGDNKALALFSYIGLLLAGLLIAASKRGWWALTALAGTATAAVLLGWELKFHAADQAPIAFAAAVALGGMLWATAWRARTPRFVGWAAAASLILVHLVTLPYLVRTSLGWVMEGGMLREDYLRPDVLGMVFLLLLAAVIPALAARKGWPVLALAGAMSLLPGLLCFGVGWIEGDEVTPPAVPLLLLASVLLAWLAARVPALAPVDPDAPRSRWPGPEHASPTLLLVVGLAWLVLAGMLDAPGQLALTSAGLAALGWLLATRPGPRWLPLAALGLGAGALHIAMLAEQPGTLGAGAAVVLVFLAAPFLLDTSARTRHLTASPLPWLAAAAAGPALFLPLHQGWEATLGSDVIGLLPLTLGAGTTAAAVVMKGRLGTDPEAQARHRAALTAFLAVALLFACLAVPVQLDREWWTVGWALEGAALAWLSRRMRNPWVATLALTLLAAVTARLVLNVEVLGYHPAPDGSLINWTLYGYGLPALALLAAAWWLRPTADDDPRAAGPWRWLRLGNPATVLMAVAVVFMLINLEVSAAFPEGERWHLWSTSLEASMTRSISWGVFGLLLMLPAQRPDLRYLRPVALVFLLMAALKVFLVDLWQLSGFVRVGSLFGVAVSLIGAALAFQRLVLRDHRPPPGQEDAP